ncbi:ribonuclease H-like domain-containing protein [Tanacetum coccineum]
MPSLPPPEPAISCFDDLDFFKDFKNEFPAIVYNDALTSKSNLLTEPILNPQHINEFDLKNKTSFSGYDEEEQSVLYFNYLFPFNIIRPDDLKSENDNDDNDIDIIQSSRGNEIIDGSSVLSKTSHDKELKVFILSTAKLRVSTAQVTTASTNQLVLLEEWKTHTNPAAAQTTTNADGTSTILTPGPVTIEEKYKDAKTLFAAIQTRFGGNEATKKTQKTLLKQMYENFSAPSTESLDSIFNRLQKIVSQLAILGESISQEDLNLKFLRSLPSEWNTHVVIWRNKPNLDTMSFDDRYNNFNIVEQEVKRTSSSSSSLSSQKLDFVSSPNSTNEVNTAYGVSTANTQISLTSTQVSTASTQVSTANLSNATVYAFLANQPNRYQLIHEDLEQIHEYDLEEMDLKWQLALLSMRTRRFFQKTGRKITIKESDTTRYDKSKVECFNSHKMGHFARECRGPRNQDSRNRNQDSSRRTVNMEETSSKAMVAINGAGFDWSYMADDEVPTNMALMDFLDSEVHNDKTCSKTCLKSFETLKTQLDNLRIEFNKSEFNLATYKRGLASVEEQLVFYKKNKVIFCEQLVVLKRDISYKDLEISMLKSEPEFEGYRPKTSKSVSEDISNEVKESPNALLVEELVSDDKLEKKTVFPTVAKIEFVRPKKQENSVRKPVKYAEMYWSQSSRGNQRNWNNQKSQQLGCDFVMFNKACFVYGSFDHVQADYNYHQRERVVSGNNYTRVDNNYSAKKAHPSAHRNIVPKAVLMKTGLRPLNTARPVNTAHPKTIVYSARSMHMTWNMSYLSDFKEFNRGYVTFGGGAKGGKITGKGTLKTGKLDFEDVYFVKELQFNLFSISQMCDKKNSVHFTDTGCFVMSPDFKLADKSQVLLKVPRKNNMYIVNMKNIGPKESLTCLVAKATLDESMLWHRRLGDEPKWLFDIDVLELNQWICADVAVQTLMNVNASNDEPQPSSDAGKKDDEGVNKESGIDDQERPKNSTQDVKYWLAGENNTQDVNTVGPSINIEPYMFSLRDNSTLEATHSDFFGDETEVNMRNITTIYLVPSTLNIRIYKDHSLDHVIGDV